MTRNFVRLKWPINWDFFVCSGQQVAAQKFYKLRRVEKFLNMNQTWLTMRGKRSSDKYFTTTVLSPRNSKSLFALVSPEATKAIGYIAQKPLFLSKYNATSWLFIQASIPTSSFLPALLMLFCWRKKHIWAFVSQHFVSCQVTVGCTHLNRKIKLSLKYFGTLSVEFGACWNSLCLSVVVNLHLLCRLFLLIGRSAF